MTIQRLTKEQAAIIGAYTGIALGPFSDIQSLAESLLRRPIWTHEFTDSALWSELKVKVKPMLIDICYRDDDTAVPVAP